MRTLRLFALRQIRLRRRGYGFHHTPRQARYGIRHTRAFIFFWKTHHAPDTKKFKKNLVICHRTEFGVNRIHGIGRRFLAFHSPPTQSDAYIRKIWSFLCAIE